jgi:hypothetical protein
MTTPISDGQRALRNQGRIVANAEKLKSARFTY